MKEKKLSLNKGSRLLIAFVSTVVLILPIAIITEASWLNWNTQCLWLLGSIYTFLFVYFGMLGFAIPRMIKIKNCKHILLLAGICATLLVIIVPIRFQEIVDANRMEKRMLQNSIIQIDVLNERNQVSLGNEVWIEGIRVGGKDYNLYDLKLSDGWEFVEGRAVTTRLGAKTLTIQLQPKSIYELMLRKTPNAGKVKITIGEYSHVFDLYSSELDQRATVDLKQVFLDDEVKTYSLQRFLFYIVYFIFAYMICILLIICANKNEMDNLL